MVSFSVTSWSAWAPGLDSPERWLQWAEGDRAIRDAGEPGVQAMPPLLRRRVGRLGRMALETAYACTKAGGGAAGLVFCSRHGEVQRSLELLATLAQGQPLSPANFSLAVHNAIAGLFSVATGDTAPATAIAGGAASVPSGVIEACGMLAEGQPDVLLVVYDEPLPALYQRYATEVEFPYAWAWRMTAPEGTGFELSWEAAEPAPTPPPAALPIGLQVLRFFLSGATAETMSCGRCTWHWTRNG